MTYFLTSGDPLHRSRVGVHISGHPQARGQLCQAHQTYPDFLSGCKSGNVCRQGESILQCSQYELRVSKNRET